MALASCKDNPKGNDPMEDDAIETTDSHSGGGTMPETPQAQDSTGMVSPDSTQASPPTVTKPQ
ncbi:hypothetical protein HYN59_16435 [Flavobacterium album]|uniref:Uncharacterized protein n=2 Tax=Flavobacterium album TaxID=2175091 RepID=A0A2S1R1P6_9FLAO|nr:hypothetical protein HYN59_16435 [Flavobacterium album]